MGQAKKRGTFEQRQADAIQREAELQERRRINLLASKERQRLAGIAKQKQAIIRQGRSGMSTAMLSAALCVALSAAPQKKEG